MSVSKKNKHSTPQTVMDAVRPQRSAETASPSVGSWMKEKQSGWAHVGTNGEQMEMEKTEDTKLQVKLFCIPSCVLLSQDPHQQDLHSPQKAF